MAKKAKRKKPSFPRSVTVTQKHINEGEPGSKYHCPIARSLRDHLEDLGLTADASLEITGSGWQEIRLTTILKLPKKIDKFIRAFDSKPLPSNFSDPAMYRNALENWKKRTKRQVKPFTFTF